MCSLATYIFASMFLMDQLCVILSLQFTVGDCPIYFQEDCNADVVKFVLSANIGGSTGLYPLDPYKLRLPYGFNVLVPLKMVIHGYGGLSIDIATGNVTAAYQEIGYNVIIVDWGPLATLPCYTTAYLNTWHVGQCISILAVSLMSLGIGPGFIHAVGFSLGAHVAGLAGSNLKQVLGYSFGRITGLDPALPFFATFKNEWKLDPGDANFVDVIHTSAGTFGKLEATGHADFYVNGGSLQPHCYPARYPPLCSHAVAGLYFAESIRRNGKKFIGTECDSITSYWLGWCTSGKKAEMGEYANFTLRLCMWMEEQGSSFHLCLYSCHTRIQSVGSYWDIKGVAGIVVGDLVTHLYHGFDPTRPPQ